MNALRVPTVRIARGVLPTLLLLCAACTSSGTPTRLALWVSAEAMAEARVAELQISTFVERDGDWSPEHDRRLPVSEGDWPAQEDLSFGIAADTLVEVQVRALDADGEEITAARAVVVLNHHERSSLALVLADGCFDLGDDCEYDAGCHGSACAGCTNGRCEAAGITPLPVFEEDDTPESVLLHLEKDFDSLPDDCTPSCPRPEVYDAASCECLCPARLDQGSLCVDLCPDNPELTRPGVCGCDGAQIDADDDGACDADGEDLCPDDGEKTRPGACGCGAVEVDRDLDGACDNNGDDACPGDANKSAPGACGCDVIESDADADGACDSNGEDACPGDGSKAAPGLCGCGVADVDVNGDGICDLNAPRCGDGTLDAGEACDDGNLVDGDGCESDCSLVCGAGLGAVAAALAPTDGACLLGFTAMTSWQGAEQACKDLGGHLATIHGDSERSAVDGVAALVGDGAWIGYNAVVSPGNFVWSSGQFAEYDSWGFGLPDNQGGAEHCVAQDQNAWDDRACATALPFVCELALLACTPDYGTPAAPGAGLMDCTLQAGELAITDPDDDGDSGSAGGAQNVAFGTQAGGHTTAYLVFRDVPLAQGADVTDARLALVASSNYPFDGSDTGADIVEIRALLVPTALANAECVETRTTASVVWDTGNWVNASEYETPALDAVIEEVVAQPGWSSGDEIHFVIETTRISGYGRAIWSLERADDFASCNMAKLRL